MAKKQTFGDKIEKSTSKSKSTIKLIRTEKSTSGFLRFKEMMVAVPDGKDAQAIVKEILSK